MACWSQCSQSIGAQLQCIVQTLDQHSIGFITVFQLDSLDVLDYLLQVIHQLLIELAHHRVGVQMASVRVDNGEQVATGQHQVLDRVAQCEWIVLSTLQQLHREFDPIAHKIERSAVDLSVQARTRLVG